MNFLKTTIRIHFIFFALWVNLLPSTARVVINEIAYHPISDSSAEEYIELYNTGPDEVDLSGWRFTDGISFEIPAGATLGASDYLVVAKDPTTLSLLFPSIPNPLGPYSGQLNNGGERVRIADASGSVVDSCDYDDALPWPNAADGGGPSLELRHPSLDNTRPENWSASDITYNASASWLAFDASFSGVEGEFFFFLTDLDGADWIGDGESVHVLFDDVVLEDLANPGANLINNGGFESGAVSDWVALRFGGTHFASLEDSFSGRYCWHYWTLGGGGVSGNRSVRYRPTVPLSLSADQAYRFRFRYRVTHGRALMSIGADTTVAATPTLLEMRPAWGTPGGANTTLASPQVPVLNDLQDVGKRIPSGTTEEVVATFSDTSRIVSVDLWYSAQQLVFSATGPVNTPDEMVWRRLLMTPDPAPNEQIFRASIPSQTENTLVRYHLSWTETGSIQHRYPHNGSHPDNLIAYVPGPVPDHDIPHFFLHLVPEYHQFFVDMMFRGGGTTILRQVRPTFPATFVDFAEGCAYEDVRWKPRGWDNLHGPLGGAFREGVSLKFRPGFYYNGEKQALGFTNNHQTRNEAGIRTRLSFEAFRRAGVPVSRTRYVWLTQNGQPMGLMTDMEAPDNRFLERWGRDGEGSLYKARWHFRGPDNSREYLFRANESTYPSLEDYELGYLKKNRRDSNHSDLIGMTHDLNAPSLTGRVFDMETNGSEIAGQRIFFEEQFDLDNILSKYGVDQVLSNFDRAHQNHFIYQNVSRGGKWETYPWDLDATWGVAGHELWEGLGQFPDGGPIEVDPAFFPFSGFMTPEPVFTRLMAVPEYREQYVLSIRKHLRDTFSERQLFELLDRYADEGRAGFHEDLAVWPDFIGLKNEVTTYCSQIGLEDAGPMDCVVAWFKDHVKQERQVAFWRVRQDDQGDNYVIPPVLSDGRTQPLVPTSGDPIEFHVNAISAGSALLLEGIETVTLHYRSSTGASQAAMMIKATTVEHDGDYSYQIASQPEGTSIEYWFETVDDIGLTDRFPETDSLYTEVVDDPTTAEALVTITEIMYHSDLLGNEWVEIQNTSDRTVDVSRWLLGDDNPEHRFRLPVDIALDPGELLVIAANEFVVREVYGIHNVVGDFEFNLGNAGDGVFLLDSAGRAIDSVTYTDVNPWPQAADGFGPSLELISTDLDNADPTSWMDSLALRGTPGRANGAPGQSARVVINEFSYDPSDQGITNDYNGDGVGDSAQDEFVELYNKTETPVDISGWSIDDDREDNDNTFVFPEGTILSAQGFLVVFGGGVPTGFTAQAFTGLPRLGNNGDQIRLSDGATDIDTISYEEGGASARVNLAIRADGGVIARETDGSLLFETRDPELATPGESNNLPLNLSADLNGDSTLNHLDLIEFLSQWRAAEEGKGTGSADLNQDNSIDATDLFMFLQDWQKDDNV